MWGTHAPDDPHWNLRVPDLGWRTVTNDKGVEKTVPELVWNVVRIYKPKPFTTVRAVVARRSPLPVAVRRRGLAIATLVPISFATSSGIAGYKAFSSNTAQAQGDAAHQPHGAAHRRDLQSVGGGALAAELAPGRSVGTWKRAKVATFKRRFPLYLLFVAGFVGCCSPGRAPTRAVDCLRDGIDDDRHRGRADLLLLLVPASRPPSLQQTGRRPGPSCSA